MQYVNDDMDDLLRRAAREYPLNTSGGQWEKIANALNKKNFSSPNGNKISRKFFWLILLLPLFLNHGDVKRNESAGENRGMKSLIIYKNDIGNKEQALTPKNLTIANMKKPFPGGMNKEALSGTNNRSSETRASTLTLTTTNNKKDNRSEFLKQDENAATLKLAQSDKYFLHPIAPVEATFPEAIEFDLLKKDINQRENVASIQTSKPTSNKKLKRFYAGAVCGAAATTVKLQKVANYGFDLGIIAGYDISKKWSIEAGVLLTQKKYYTDGKEFNTSKMYLPPNTKITTVEGGCRMIELPVVARFHFSSSQKNTWFASAGISSFLMEQEDYDYTFLYTNSGRSVKYSKTYKNASENWVSTAQLSGGYIYQVKDKFEIRAEPYIQIPLKRVGFGNLPLTNTGLRIGVTKKLF